MIECAILLEARNPAKNIFRSYYVSVCYDLFERLLIEVIHGRIGAKGKRTAIHADNKAEAISLISDLLKRRESAFKRLGVPYSLKLYSGRWDMDEALFPFRQAQLFDEPYPIPDKKKPMIKEIIREGEGLFR